MKRLLKNHQSGDTIIEVLLAVVIVGLAIGISYGVATRSLRAARQSQERVEALKHAEGQIERLKNIADSKNTQGIFDNVANVFCISDANTKTNFAADYGSSTVKSLTDDNLEGYPTECVEGLYRLSIEKSGNTFTVTVRWFSFGSTAKEETKISYRLYPL